MRYPKFLGKNQTIGACAPSFGCSENPYRARLNNAIKKFEAKGYSLKLSQSVYSLDHIRSASAQQRVKEFEDLYFDDNVHFIFSVGGGEVMNETMPYYNFEKIKRSTPKWFMGFSDNSWLAFALPTICDVAAIYGYNLPGFGSTVWHQSLSDCYNIITGTSLLQHNYDFYQLDDPKHTPGQELCTLNDIVPTCWKNLRGSDDVKMEGRLIGGCLDIMCSFPGTPFDNVKNFLEKYKNDGFVWFFESCDLNIISQLRSYWFLHQCGWFKYCKGIIIGRPYNRESAFGLTYEDILKEAFADDDFPIIYDADIGHLPPINTLITGSYVKIDLTNKKGTIETYLK